MPSGAKSPDASNDEHDELSEDGAARETSTALEVQVSEENTAATDEAEENVDHRANKVDEEPHLELLAHIDLVDGAITSGVSHLLSKVDISYSTRYAAATTVD